MNPQTKEAADYKLNTFWREVVLSDDAPVTEKHCPNSEDIGAGLRKSPSREKAATGTTSEIGSRPSAICDR